MVPMPQMGRVRRSHSPKLTDVRGSAVQTWAVWNPDAPAKLQGLAAGDAPALNASIAELGAATPLTGYPHAPRDSLPDTAACLLAGPRGTWGQGCSACPRSLERLSLAWPDPHVLCRSENQLVLSKPGTGPGFQEEATPACPWPRGANRPSWFQGTPCCLLCLEALLPPLEQAHSRLGVEGVAGPPLDNAGWFSSLAESQSPCLPQPRSFQDALPEPGPGQGQRRPHPPGQAGQGAEPRMWIMQAWISRGLAVAQGPHWPLRACFFPCEVVTAALMSQDGAGSHEQQVLAHSRHTQGSGRWPALFPGGWLLRTQGWPPCWHQNPGPPGHRPGKAERRGSLAQSSMESLSACPQQGPQPLLPHLCWAAGPPTGVQRLMAFPEGARLVFAESRLSAGGFGQWLGALQMLCGHSRMGSTEPDPALPCPAPPRPIPPCPAILRVGSRRPQPPCL